VIDTKKLLDTGYAKYKPTSIDSEWLKARYQKCYRDKKGNKKYFLDVEEYKPLPHQKDIDPADNFEITTQVYIKGNHHSINMRFLTPDVAEAESILDKMLELGIIENYEDAE